MQPENPNEFLRLQDDGCPNCPEHGGCAVRADWYSWFEIEEVCLAAMRKKLRQWGNIKGNP